MKNISILGSTGSIGTQTLEVVAKHKDAFQVIGLSTNRNIALLIEQINIFKPKFVAVCDLRLKGTFEHLLPTTVKCLYGIEGMIEIACAQEVELVVTAIMGSVGLKPTLAAIEAQKTIGIANKETLVMAGEIVTNLAREKQVELLPVDSEHSAIFQCLQSSIDPKEVDNITLTASGGSFRDFSREQLKNVTKSQALAHPNWSMGEKITIDSATMANKGLEVIEAHWLFNLSYDKIKVLLHPESIVHSFVSYIDGSILAHLGEPDMCIPIQYALTYPKRMEAAGKVLSLEKLSTLHFKPMDYERYPLLKLAYQSGRSGGTMPAVFNAANEQAVQLFLEDKITFLEIEALVEKALDAHQPLNKPNLEAILFADAWARKTVISMSI